VGWTDAGEELSLWLDEGIEERMYDLTVLSHWDNPKFFCVGSG